MLRTDKQLRRALWTHVATTLGGTHTFSEDVAEESIDAIIDGIAVRLDSYTIRSGHTTQVYTRVSAPYRFPPGPTMQVYEEGWLQTLGKTLGAQDVVLGHTAFDARFIVKAERPAVARRLWSPPTMQQMLDGLTSTMVTSTHASVTLIEPKLWDEEVKLRGGILLVGALAARDLYGRGALAALGHLIERAGERPRAELDVGVRVVCGAEDRDDHLVMAARVEQTVVDAPIEIVDGHAAASLPQVAHVFLPHVGTGTLVPDGFVWADLELDAGRLRAGADLLGALAGAGHGVYR